MTTGTEQNPTTESSRTHQMGVAAQEQGTAVAETAMEAGRNVGREAARQVSAVATEGKTQLDSIVHQAKGELRSEVDTRGRQAADGLMTLSRQILALAEGRREEAGRVGEIVDDAQQRLQSYAERLQQRGPQAVVEDATSFARRRPGLFLVGAVASGFMIGRLVRAGAAANKEQQKDSASAGNGWDDSWERRRTQPRMSAGAITGETGMSGPSDQAWPSTGPTGNRAGRQFGTDAP